MEQDMYDSFSTDYDRFVNWQNRLSLELPFIIRQLQQINAMSVLDAATGTGMHAIAFTQLGYKTAGSDISTGMIKKARLNAVSAGVQVQFEVVGFGNLVTIFGKHSFDALLCLGNSLPHLLTRIELDKALTDFASCIKPGGLLIVQNRNFDTIMNNQTRWMEPQSYSAANTEWIFQRFYDFNTDGLITFNLVTLKREGLGNWSQNVVSSRLRPLLQDELLQALEQAGFESISSFGNLSGDAFEPESSGNLVILSRLPS
jgi:glycine/sarcosine N-methyltransferase